MVKDAWVNVIFCGACGHVWDGMLDDYSRCPECESGELHEGHRTENRRTLEDIPPADREYSSPYHDKYGIKVTATGIDWSERTQDPDYIYALTHHSEPPDPADRDDWDDR